MIRSFFSRRTSVLPDISIALRSITLRSIALRQRGLLVAWVALAAFVTYTLTYTGPIQGDDPALLRLLRGMVILKGVIGLATLGLLFWRMGRPVQAGQWMGYMAAALLIPVAVTWLWSLRLIPLGSLVFYSGLAIGIASAWRDRQFLPWRR